MQVTNPMEGGGAPMVDIGAALDRMTAVLRPVDAARVVLDDALGRIAATDVPARLDA